MLAILRGMGQLRINFSDSKRMDDAKFLFQNANVDENGSFSPKVSQAIKALWQDEGVLQCWRRSDEYQLNDSAAYFLDAIDRISSPEYQPTLQDIVRTRVKSTGIVEQTCIFRGLTFRILDVGGQRSERKKWISCFEGVDAIIFVAALSEYDLIRLEDGEMNRMRESMALFHSVCNNRWFRETNILLFLNKWDIFKKKIRTSPLNQCFADYRGANEPDEAGSYIRRRFQALNKNPAKEIYAHFTCATDAENIEHVFNSTADVLIRANLAKQGIQ
uniref:Guanine nucleotide-binding protein G(I) subunit alpha n=2 Tax=Schistocephalus solidus TaxID=70667 RepID=A0A0V0J9X6_SCHSO